MSDLAQCTRSSERSAETIRPAIRCVFLIASIETTAADAILALHSNSPRNTYIRSISSYEACASTKEISSNISFRKGQDIRRDLSYDMRRLAKIIPSIIVRQATTSAFDQNFVSASGGLSLLCAVGAPMPPSLPRSPFGPRRISPAGRVRRQCFGRRRTRPPPILPASSAPGGPACSACRTTASPVPASSGASRARAGGRASG